MFEYFSRLVQFVVIIIHVQVILDVLTHVVVQVQDATIALRNLTVSDAH